MPNNIFHFKQFRIKQEKCAMKVGTDAVLLGSWVQTRESKNILDIGTGTGIIALMLAQKSEAFIHALDIDRYAVEQAIENVAESPFKNNIFIYHKSLQSFADEVSFKYDLIVSNPPYFVDSSKAPDQTRNFARHTDELSYDDLLIGVNKLLQPQGKFCLILPIKEGQLFIDKALAAGLYCNKITRVKTRKDKEEPKRLLLCLSYSEMTLEEDLLVIEEEDRHQYTPEYIALTKDYYIHF